MAGGKQFVKLPSIETGVIKLLQVSNTAMLCLNFLRVHTKFQKLALFSTSDRCFWMSLTRSLDTETGQVYEALRFKKTVTMNEVQETVLSWRYRIQDSRGFFIIIVESHNSRNNVSESSHSCR